MIASVRCKDETKLGENIYQCGFTECSLFSFITNRLFLHSCEMVNDSLHQEKRTSVFVCFTFSTSVICLFVIQGISIRGGIHVLVKKRRGNIYNRVGTDREKGRCLENPTL